MLSADKLLQLAAPAMIDSRISVSTMTLITHLSDIMMQCQIRFRSLGTSKGIGGMPETKADDLNTA